MKRGKKFFPPLASLPSPFFARRSLRCAPLSERLEQAIFILAGNQNSITDVIGTSLERTNGVVKVYLAFVPTTLMLWGHGYIVYIMRPGSCDCNRKV